MDNQEKIKWLKQYRLNELEIIRLKEELQWWRSQSERVTSGTGGTGGGSGAHDDRLQCAVDGITTLQSQLSEQLLTRVQLRSDIAAAIGSIPDERLQQLMRYRYIDGWTWERIAVGMSIEYRWARRLHGRALEKLTLESPPRHVI